MPIGEITTEPRKKNGDSQYKLSHPQCSEANICLKVDKYIKLTQRACSDQDEGGIDERVPCQNAFADCQNEIANSTVRRGSEDYIAMIKN